MMPAECGRNHPGACAWVGKRGGGTRICLQPESRLTAVCDVRRRTPTDGDSRCQDCDHAYSPWVTDNPLWNQVVGGEGTTSDPGGFLCPACFMRHTEAIHGPTIWRVVPMWRPRP